ncbi:hypothetical protein F2P81_018867 [Scophthalmus maximus]|uniref:Uncharacterized protein n=1 Tax=Scophthalmus maximus TaxID=52904 RepID=A0A6A4SHA6_SCOMX|nr:hypothetical protein F2P81_018867 [Scophthalmus maximus]
MQLYKLYKPVKVKLPVCIFYDQVVKQSHSRFDFGDGLTDAVMQIRRKYGQTVLEFAINYEYICFTCTWSKVCKLSFDVDYVLH